LSATARRTVSLPAEHAANIDFRVADGTCASASEVICAGLRALQERDAVMERRLRSVVARTSDAALAHPHCLRLPDDVMDRLRARHVQKIKDVS
jgi:antitoxin ParD1/3/4